MRNNESNNINNKNYNNKNLYIYLHVSIDFNWTAKRNNQITTTLLKAIVVLKHIKYMISEYNKTYKALDAA
jgi:hypothetical protein